MSVSSKTSRLSNMDTSMVESILRKERELSKSSATLQGLSLEVPAPQRIAHGELPVKRRPNAGPEELISSSETPISVTAISDEPECRFPGE